MTTPAAAPASAPYSRASAASHGGRVALALALAVTLLAGSSAAQSRTFKGKECTVKTDAPKPVGKAYVERIDNYCKVFGEFFDDLGLDENNDNKIIARVFNEYEAFKEFHDRNFDSPTPAAFFSPGMNAIVLYNAEGNVNLRQVLFHEVSHNFLNRYIYLTPPWINEGLAEYFEGWLMSETGEFIEVRPHLYDLILVQGALNTDKAISPEELIGLSRADFKAFAKGYPELDSYLHYATMATFVYYCLEGGHEGDRDLLVGYLRELNDRGENARFEVDDWPALEARWRAFTLSLSPERTRLDDHLLVASGFRRGEHWELAAEEYRAALAREPSLANAQIGLARVLLEAEDYAGAYDAYERNIELDPENQWSYYWMSLIIVRYGLDDAPRDYRLALELAERANELADGENLYIRLMVARAHNVLGDPSLSIKLTKKILRDVDRDDEDTKTYFKEWLEVFETREEMFEERR